MKMKFLRKDTNIAILEIEGSQKLLLNPLFPKNILEKGDGTWSFGHVVVERDGRPYLYNGEKTLRNLEFLGNAETPNHQEVFSVWQDTTEWIIVSHPWGRNSAISQPGALSRPVSK